jgi:hypothetical protein
VSDAPIDYRTMLDKEHLGAWDLAAVGGEKTLIIERVEAGVVGRDAKKQRKPILYFAGVKSGKGMVANVTNCKTIANLYGTDVRAWVGKPITLYAAKTQFGSEQVDCIRVRPTVSKPRKGDAEVTGD